MTGFKNLVCTECAHCGALELNAQLTREYECRANPPTVSFVATPQGGVKFTGYPSVSDKTPACGLFEIDQTDEPQMPPLLKVLQVE